MVDKVIYADVTNGETTGSGSALLINDLKDKTNQLIDINDTMGSAITKDVADTTQAFAGEDKLITASDVIKLVSIRITSTDITGTITLDESMPIGTKWIVRKINGTEGVISVSCPGHSFTRTLLSSVPLNADGDNWLLEKVTNNRIDVIGGFCSGTYAEGKWTKYSNGKFEIIGSLTMNSVDFSSYSAVWNFPVNSLNPPVVTATMGNMGALGIAERQGVLYTSNETISSAAFVLYNNDATYDLTPATIDLNAVAHGDWY